MESVPNVVTVAAISLRQQVLLAMAGIAFRSWQPGLFAVTGIAFSLGQPVLLAMADIAISIGQPGGLAVAVSAFTRDLLPIAPFST